jgi:hypothetical protein
VLAGRRDVAGHLLIIDEEGGWPVVSLIETLADRSSVSALTVVTSLPGLGAPELSYSLELGAVTRRLSALGLEIHAGAVVEHVVGRSVRLAGGPQLGPFDEIVLSTGTVAPDLPLGAIAIGDAVAPRGLWAATNDATQLAYTL